MDTSSQWHPWQRNLQRNLWQADERGRSAGVVWHIDDTLTWQNHHQVPHKRNCVRNTQDTTTLTATGWTGHPTVAENWAQQTEGTPVQQDDNWAVKNVPLQQRSNDQRATSPALPAPGHLAEDRLARGSAPDGEAVWDLAALRRMVAFVRGAGVSVWLWWSRQKTYYLVIKEDLLSDDQGRRLIARWSRQKTYYLVIKAENLLPGDQSRRPITWWSKQKTYYLMIKAEGLLPDDQGRRPITWWSRQKTYYLMIKAEDLLPDDQGRRPITWWSRQKTYYLVIKAEDLLYGDQCRRHFLVIKAEDLLPGDQGRRPITWWSRRKTYYLMIKAEDLLPGDQGIRLIAWWSRKKTYCPPCNRLHSPWSSWCFHTWPPWSRHHLWMACTQRASHRHRHPETTSPPPDHTAEFERHGSWNPEVLAPHSQESQQACELTPVDQASEWKSVICSAESASSSARQSVVPIGMGHNTCTSSSWLS